MANIKYVRVSTKEQNEARQLHDSNNYDKVYIEKASGKNTNREQLKTMLAYVREGDTLTVESYSRLARNTHDLLEIIEQLNAKGVTLISQKEGINTRTALTANYNCQQQEETAILTLPRNLQYLPFSCYPLLSSPAQENTFPQMLAGMA